MDIRIVGIASAVIGSAAIAMGIWSFVTVEGMVGDVASMDAPVDTKLWKQRLQLSSSVVSVAGLITIAGGLALFRRRRWGLLLLAAAAAGLGAFPWLLAASGQAVFPFETPSLAETLFLGAVAVLAVLAFFAQGRRSVDARERAGASPD